MIEFERENRYLVAKKSDVLAALTDKELLALCELMGKVDAYHFARKDTFLRCVYGGIAMPNAEIAGWLREAGNKYYQLSESVKSPDDLHQIQLWIDALEIRAAFVESLTHIPNRWHVEETEGGVRICRGLHKPDAPCQWAEYKKGDLVC